MSFSISAFLSHSFMLSFFLSLSLFSSFFLTFCISLSRRRKRRNETTAKAWKIFIQLGTTNKKVEWVGGKKSKQDDIRDTTIASNEKEKNGRVRESACVRKGESKREREEMTWSSGPVHGFLSIFSIKIFGDKPSHHHNHHHHHHHFHQKHQMAKQNSCYILL